MPMLLNGKVECGWWMVEVDGGRRDEATYLPPRAVLPQKPSIENIKTKLLNSKAIYQK